MLELIENLIIIKSISIIFIIMHLAHIILKIVDIFFLMNKKGFRVIFFKYSGPSLEQTGVVLHTINVLVYILVVFTLIISIHGWLPTHLYLDSNHFLNTYHIIKLYIAYKLDFYGMHTNLVF
ncbi:hypothetical protein NEPAR06_0523 [Nematocida parisii]|nr:hypothetical protein NEPAR07_0164 [Nematocida parisii]KAI5153523.1 hypothetical protein NEPAR06_0523 [Nematocida parisii]KAI5156946.1 hypothetical protein NEPAR05_0929 [Nematocida parisii]